MNKQDKNAFEWKPVTMEILGNPGYKAALTKNGVHAVFKVRTNTGKIDTLLIIGDRVAWQNGAVQTWDELSKFIRK
ncbi:MAG: hypothetical protein V1767_03565 [Chloroflexota bacterium]